MSLPLKLQVRNFAREQALRMLSALHGRADVSVPHVQFLYFHHVFEDEIPQLRKLLQRLSHQYTFLGYIEAVGRISTGAIDKPYLCFSSDDGFKNNLNAIEVFKEFGVSCCYFICPGFIGESDYDRSAEISRSVFHLPPVEFLNWADVERLQACGHEIGNHSFAHHRLSTLPEHELEADIMRAHESLERHCGKMKHFAYPYGGAQDITDKAVDLIFNLGYISCATAIRGAYVTAVHGQSSRELIKRDPVIFFKNDHVAYFTGQNIKAAAAAI